MPPASLKPMLSHNLSRLMRETKHNNPIIFIFFMVWRERGTLLTTEAASLNEHEQRWNRTATMRRLGGLPWGAKRRMGCTFARLTIQWTYNSRYSHILYWLKRRRNTADNRTENSFYTIYYYFLINLPVTELFSLSVIVIKYEPGNSVPAFTSKVWFPRNRYWVRLKIFLPLISQIVMVTVFSSLDR